MKKIRMAVLIALCLMAVGDVQPAFAQKRKTPVTPAEAGIFNESTYSAGLEKAKATGRPLMIDFFTTWCGPCRRLDETTWANKEVKAFLAERTIPIKIDAEKESALAEQFSVEAFPTVVFVSQDGKEIDRFVGYLSPTDFLSEARDILSGKDLVTRVEEKLAVDPDNPDLRRQYATALANADRPEEALREFLWCLDRGVDENPEFTSQMGDVAKALVNLGKTHPPALAALRQRRDQLAEVIAAGQGTRRQTNRYLIFNRALDEREQALGIFSQLKQLGDKGKAGRLKIGPSILGQLVRASQYTDAEPFQRDLTADFEEAIQRVETVAREMKDRKAKGEEFDKLRKEVGEVFGGLIEAGFDGFEISAGLGRTAEARKIADSIIKLDPTPERFVSLIARANKAGKIELAQILVEQARQTLSKDQFPKVESALAKR
jgi:thioredoxin-like negative regulator of GroEL